MLSTVNFETHWSLEAPKRKMSDAPAEKASKRICEKVQETIPVGGGGSNEAPDCVINPAEQGILSHHYVITFFDSHLYLSQPAN